MKKLLMGLVGIGLLGACGQVVNGFSVFNLKAPKEACLLNTSTQIIELNLSFNYTGTLKSARFTFTPNGKTPVIADVPNLETPPAGLRLFSLSSNEIKLFVDLNALQPVGAQAIPQPVVKQIYPMDVKLEVTGSNGEKPGALELTGIDVAKCYPAS